MTVANFEEAVTETQRRLAQQDPFDIYVRFNFGDDGEYLVDGRTTPPSFLPNSEGDVQATMSMSGDTFVGLTNKTLVAPAAMMTGKLKVKGSMLKVMALAKKMD